MKERKQESLQDCETTLTRLIEKQEEATQLYQERHKGNFENKLDPKFVGRDPNMPGFGYPLHDKEVETWYRSTVAILLLYFGESNVHTKEFRKLEKEHTIKDHGYGGINFDTHASGRLLHFGILTLDAPIQELQHTIVILLESPDIVKNNAEYLIRKQIAKADEMIFPELYKIIPDIPMAKEWRNETISILTKILPPEDQNLQNFIKLDNAFLNARPLFTESKEILLKIQDSLATSISSVSVPVEIQESLVRFKKDHPDPQKVTFIVMRFTDTPAHANIVSAIKSELAKHGITGLRADDHQYHDDVLYNILTYIYGCNFGVAVFDRIEEESFNPNISFEIGYMMALKKDICILKDKTLQVLHTDIIGRLYEPFDPQDPMASIPPLVKKWLKGKKLVK